jgi:hypothetical protein
MGHDQTGHGQLNMKRGFALGLLLIGVTQTTSADSLTNTHRAAFFLASRTVAIPENGTVVKTVLCTPGYEFAFLPPRNWRMTLQTNAIQLSWMHPDQVTEITLAIHRQDNPSDQQLPPAKLRQSLLSRYPESTLVNEFVCYTSSGSGQAFDLDYVLAERFRTSTRVARVPFKDGYIEFTLTSPANRFAPNQLELGLLLNSFAIAPRSGP